REELLDKQNPPSSFWNETQQQQRGTRREGRCVIIQRDKNGFGLTVSGDNPVFVQLVKEGKAGRNVDKHYCSTSIKVNGTLVTRSNHKEVVKLIKSGSYVALTVLGRPPGLSQMPLEEAQEQEEHEEVSMPLPLSAPNSPALSGVERSSFLSGSPQNHNKCTLSDGVRPQPRVPRDSTQVHMDLVLSQYLATHSTPVPEASGKRESPLQSPDVCRRDDLNSCSSPDTEDAPDTDSSPHSSVASPPYTVNPQIIGAEDDYFDYQQEQINGECSCFQSIDLLKSRPAHLAVFLHHVVSQFEAAPLLCYLYAEMHKQTSSKESRRFFMEFHSLFLDRTANLKVPVPETIAAELAATDRTPSSTFTLRRLELIPEDLCKQYTQVLQDSLLSDLLKNLEDFRQKRSMGLTLAEDELSKLDSERGKDQPALEKECACAEHILAKIEDILPTTQASEEEKCQAMQYVILTYMKHLGVKVKEPRGLEQKRARITFLPKIKRGSKPEKDGDWKKPRFPNLLVPPRRLSRVDSTLGKEKLFYWSHYLYKPILDHMVFMLFMHFYFFCLFHAGVSPFCIQSRLSDGLQAAEHQDSLSSPISTQFDFSPSSVDHREDDQDFLSGNRMEIQPTVGSADFQSEDDQAGEVESEEDPLNWQKLVPRGVLASLTSKEIKRQEVINELFITERAHLRKLRVLDGVFCQRLSRHGILPPDDIKHIFTNLEEIIQLHVSITEQMTAIRKRSETSVIGQIGDDLLAWFSEEEEKIKRAIGMFCSNQPSALELIKTRQKKDQRFNLFMQEAESNRLCRRLQLKDIIPVEMQRMTKYPLLLDNIAKYSEDGEEREKVKKAGECCKKILNHVNQAVKEAENKQRLVEYQRRLDVSSLKQSENPMILELRNLDLTKREMVYEGPLSWKVNKDKTIELYTLLLEDIMVLLQKQDERLVLKFHGKNLTSIPDAKHSFSPVIKLSTVLVRPVATDNKAFFVLSMSENGVQMYELMAQKVSDRRTWQCLITQCADAMKAKAHPSDRPPAQIFKIVLFCVLDKDAPCSLDIQSPINPFDGLKSEDEEEELAAIVRQEEDGEEEEVDEAELEAFLDGQLTDRLLQEGSRQGIALPAEDMESNFPSSKAEEALRTRGFAGLDFEAGSGESSTDDDVAIDMRKLLSSSSQAGGDGPDLSRQLMTHLRLLQADLQYLQVKHTGVCFKMSLSLTEILGAIMRWKNL
uniref:Rho guanine nucleotide exchange factor (GEF) 12b n=1 Tax=Xiphophorus couchianus TaxID=32473 RepID=A0A3B5MML9_9TELE